MKDNNASSKNNLDIAIVGMAGRFPGASDLEEFWSNLVGGIESVTACSEQEVIESGFHPEVAHDPNFVAFAGKLDGEYEFDADFFGIAPREAEIMDPQHRVLLECAWNALEAAGYDPESYAGRIGVYAGASTNTYFPFHIASNHRLLSSVGLLQAVTANDKDFLASRISYKLNLKGPAISVQTACSTALVAVNLACHSLLNYQCDMVLAGGVSITPKGRLYTNGSIFAADGRCRPFDGAAQGAVFGNGVGMVVLKRLEDALADLDHIHAIIKGSAVNNDGSLKAGYTAPSVNGQMEAIIEAQALAAVPAETIQYVEAHGTGTALGDPIEVSALTQAFRAWTRKNSYCALGSVKGNIGHLDAAAGIAGLIKTILVLERKQIPPTLHFQIPNPSLDLGNSPFFINASLRDWFNNALPRRAAVSSFGFGGTNAHAILEQAPEDLIRSDAGPDWHLLPVSARTDSSLQAAAKQLARFCNKHPQTNLADIAFTLQTGRRHFRKRAFAVANENAETAAYFDDQSFLRSSASVEQEGPLPVIFMFPGEGQYFSGIARDFDESEPVFWDAIRQSAQFASRYLDYSLIDLVYPNPASQVDESDTPLSQPQYREPALFAVEYALACLWRSWGIRPTAMIGQRTGEYVAACLAGVFSLEDAIKLVCAGSGGLLPSPSVAVHLSQAFEGIKTSEPQIPYVSTVTGEWATATQVCAPAYWINQRLRPIRFKEGLQTLASLGKAAFLELGPTQGLAELASQYTENILCLHGGMDHPRVLYSLGQLWAHGATIEWKALHQGRLRRRIPLPGYQFDRKLYFVPPSHSVSVTTSETAPSPDLCLETATGHAVAVGRASAPNDELERLITGIWQQVLGVETLGPEDDFFVLGGHSLMAIQLMAEIRRRAGIDVPIKALFEKPTVSALAGYIRNSRDHCSTLAESEAIQPVSREGELPLSFHQEEVWRFETTFPGTTRYTGVISMILNGDLVYRGLECALNEIVRRHEVLRTTYHANAAGNPVAVVHSPERLALEVIDIADLGFEAGRQEVLRAANKLVRTHFDLSSDQFIRPQLFKTAANEHVLLICSHYIAVDGWTVGLIVREMSELYAAYVELRPARLPEARVQCIDVAHWHRSQMMDRNLEPHLAYWRRQLSDITPQEPVPLDHPRPPMNAMRGSTLHFSLTPESTQALKDFSHRHGSTLFFTLLSSLNVLFYLHSGSRDIVIGTITGDREPGMEAMFGSFVNCLPLRNQLRPEQSFLDVLESTRNCTTDAYAHQLPFSKITELFSTGRDLINNPLFNVMLVLRNVPFTELKAGELDIRLSSLPVTRGVSEGDLSIYLQEFGGSLSGYLEYNCQTFELCTVQELTGDFINLLDLIPANTSCTLFELGTILGTAVHSP